MTVEERDAAGIAGIRYYLGVLTSRWKLAGAVFAACAITTVLITALTPQKYSAQTTLYISAQTRGDNASVAYQGSLLSEQRIKSYTELIVSPRVAAEAASRIGLERSPAEISSNLSASAAADTVLLNVTATDANPQLAASLSNAVAQAFGDLVASLERPSDGQGGPAVRASVVLPADVPTSPSSPSWTLNLLLGVLLGSALAVGAAFLRDSLDNTVTTVADLEGSSKRPCIGEVLANASSQDQPLIVRSANGSPEAEAYRRIRTNLQFVNLDVGSRLMVFTSALEGEGKTTSTANLACVIADAGASVLVIDADLRKSSLSRLFGIEATVGLTAVLAGHLTLRDAVQGVERNLHVLPTGHVPPNPSEMLASESMVKLIDSAKQAYDYVLIDSAPVLPVADALSISASADSVVLLCRSGQTPKAAVSAAVTSLEGVSAPLLGTLLTMVPHSRAGYGYGYGYGRDNAGTVRLPPAGGGQPQTPAPETTTPTPFRR